MRLVIFQPDIPQNTGTMLRLAACFGLAVDLKVSVPNVDRPAAEALVAKAHEVCPYSNATRGNIPVTLTVA